MKLLDTNILNGQVQKIVEAANGYIVNGHYYDKTNLVPRPFKLIPTISSINDLAMSKRLVINNAWAHHFKTQNDTIVIDRYDPTITYLWTTDIRNNNVLALKVRENNGNIDLLNSKAQGATPTTYPFLRSYCGQDALYLYYIFTTNTYHDYFVKVDKTSLVITNIEDFSSYSWTTFLKETASHIYFAVKKGYGTNVMKRYNKTTATSEIFPIAAKTTNIYFSSCYTDIVSNSDTEFYTFGISHIQATNKYIITRYKFDTTQTTLANVMIEADCAITWGSVVTQLPVFPSNAAVHYEPFITTASNGNKYLNIAIYEVQATSTVANLSSYGIYTFLIDTIANTLTFKNFVQVSSDYFRGFVSLRDNTFVVAATQASTIFLAFDETNEIFQITQSLSNQPYHFGIDQSENIFIVNALNEVDYLNTVVPTNVTVKPELDRYSYTSVDINTFCTLNCQNFSGSYISAKIQLTIKGPAVFTASNSKIITLQTLTTGDLQVPMKIQGGSPVTIQPVYIM